MEEQEKNTELNNAGETDRVIDGLVHLEDEVGDKEYVVDLDLLPPGHRFVPTDEELLTIYLKRKVLNMSLPPNRIKEQNIYEHSPMEIFDGYDGKGEPAMYFFTPRVRKYPNGNRPNRAAGAIGFWKASGKAFDVVGRGRITVGKKRSLVYYLRGDEKVIKTDWLMNEYTLIDNTTPRKRKNPSASLELDKWVRCKVYKKKNSAQEGESSAVKSTDSHPVERQNEPQTMQTVNRSMPAQLSTTVDPSHAMRPTSLLQMPNYSCHTTYPTSSSQMPNYHSYAMCLGSSSQMPNYHSYAISLGSSSQMPNYHSQANSSESSSQMPNYHSQASSSESSSRMPFYNNSNNGQNGFSMHQYMPEMMQIADSNYNMSVQQWPTPPFSFSSTNGPQMSSYCHNGQNGFPAPQDHLIGLEVPPWESNPPEHNSERDYKMDVPDSPIDWRAFLELDQDDFDPLDIGESPSDPKSDDVKNPRQEGS